MHYRCASRRSKNWATSSWWLRGGLWGNKANVGHFAIGIDPSNHEFTAMNHVYDSSDMVKVFGVENVWGKIGDEHTPDDGNEYYPEIDDDLDDHPRSRVFNLLIGLISLIAMALFILLLAFGIIKLVEFVR